jgi:uncharacterized protein with GYD domain
MGGLFSRGGFTMPRFVMLVNYTDKGIANLKDSPKRADAFRAMVAKHGGKVEQQFWCMGAFDGLVVLNAPSDEAMSAIALSVGQMDAIRTTTLRAYDEAEFQAILKKV